MIVQSCVLKTDDRERDEREIPNEERKKPPH